MPKGNRSQKTSRRDDPLKRKAEGCFGSVFFGLFALGGLGALFATFILPVWGIVEARGWLLETCVVTSSEVAESSGSDGGSTYRVAIEYTYQVAGQSYDGDRYNFSVGSSSGYDGKKRIVDAYPVGAEVPCFIDPHDPSRAVLNRDPGLFLLWGLLAVPFLAIGFGGMIFLLKRPKQARKAKDLAPSSMGPTQRRASRTSPAPAASGGGAASFLSAPPPAYDGEIVDSPPSGLADAEAFPPDARGNLVLVPLGNAKAMAIGAAVFAVVTNLALFLWILPGLWTSPSEADTFDWFMMLFTVPIVLIGLASIGGFIYFALATTNPRPRLILDQARPVLGDTCRVSWTFAGDVTKIDSLKITLQGRETAVYQQGTNTRTSHHVFFTQVLTETRHVESRGSATFQIPSDTLPSFEASRNRVEWQLVVHGDIPRWPDVKETLTFPVYPPGLAPTGPLPKDPGGAA